MQRVLLIASSNAAATSNVGTQTQGTANNDGISYSCILHEGRKSHTVVLELKEQMTINYVVMCEKFIKESTARFSLIVPGKAQ